MVVDRYCTNRWNLRLFNTIFGSRLLFQQLFGTDGVIGCDADFGAGADEHIHLFGPEIGTVVDNDVAVFLWILGGIAGESFQTVTFAHVGCV